MNRSLAAVMLFAATIASAAANSTVPRAWLVTKGGAQAVLVGESHFGNPVEYDSYFETVVKPSYAVAEVAVMESYFGPEQRHNEAFERGRPMLSRPEGCNDRANATGFRRTDQRHTGQPSGGAQLARPLGGDSGLPLYDDLPRRLYK